MKKPFPSPAELAAEAREALRKHPPKTGRELYIELVREGFINAKFEVTKLIGGSAEPEPDYQNWIPPEEKEAPAKGKNATHPKSKSAK
jgi:hypothetical protein